MRQTFPPDKSNAGFSLLELVVSIAVMTVVFGAVFTLMHSSIQSSASNYETTDAQQALRIVHEATSRDLYSAGDGLIGINDIRVPLGFAQNYLSSQSAAALDPDGDGFVRLPLVLSDDNLPAATALINGPSGFARAGSDRLTIMQEDIAFTPLPLPVGAVAPSGASVSVTAADIGKFTTGEVYFMTNGSVAAFGAVTGIFGLTVNFAGGDALGLNQPNAANGFFSRVSANGTVAVTLKRMRLIHYYLTDTGLLARRVFGTRGGAYSDSVIAEHITALDFRYVLDLANPDGSLQQPVAQLDTEARQNAVRQVETAVTAETARPLQHSGQRASFTASQQICVRNLQFREAAQPGGGVIE